MTINMTSTIIDPTQMEPLPSLQRDVRRAAATLTSQEARYLVDLYYLWQEDRKRARNQVLAMGEAAEPHSAISWAAASATSVENNLKTLLGAYAEGQIVGRWSLSIHGIGPVLAAGLLAHIDITKAPTVGHIWRFAGLDPTVTWDKGAKRPWNAQLKTLCWKLGESFVKVSNADADVYGHIYRERKDWETSQNEAYAYREQAAEKLNQFKIGKDTEAYAHYITGKLPPAHIHARAKRYSVKLYLSHHHHVAYESHFKTPPPNPYPFEHLQGHVHFIPPPNWPL